MPKTVFQGVTLIKDPDMGELRGQERMWKELRMDDFFFSMIEDRQKTALGYAEKSFHPAEDPPV